MRLPTIPLSQFRELSVTQLLSLSSPVTVHERTPDRVLAVIVPYAEFVKLQTRCDTLEKLVAKLGEMKA